MVKQLQIKNISLNISTISSQEEEVNDLISDLKVSKSTGPSSLPTKIMKQLNDMIANLQLNSLTNHFKVVSFQIFSKIAKVIPVFKSESRVLCNKYRPISLVSKTSKLIRKLINNLAFSLVFQLIMH